MKKVVGVLLIIVSLFIGIEKVSAHPGRTDKYGCHTCRTNCAYWGLSYGQYHCHNGGSSSSSRSYNTTTRTTTKKIIYGCTNNSAINYDSSANVSDGSCKYEKTEVETQTVSYKTITQGDLNVGDKTVVREGQNGEKEVTIKKIVDESGNEISSEVISENIIKEPVDEIVSYSNSKYKQKSGANSKEDGTGGVILVTIILLIINIVYASKNKNSKIIINQIKKVPIWLRFILYFLYFVFIIPIYIDIILVIIDLIIKKGTK